MSIALHALLLLAATLLRLPTAGAAVQDPVVVQGRSEVVILDFGAAASEAGPTLRELIKLCHEVTGTHFTFEDSPQLQRDLDERRVTLVGAKTVRKEDFYSFFQTLLRAHGFVCVPYGAGEMAIVKIVRNDAASQAEIRGLGLYVPPGDVHLYADLSGTYIRTIVPLHHARSPAVGNSLRSALSGGGPGAGQDCIVLVPADKGSGLLIQGFGPFVAAAMQMVQEFDAQAAEAEPVPPPGARTIPGPDRQADQLQARLRRAEQELAALRALLQGATERATGTRRAR